MTTLNKTQSNTMTQSVAASLVKMEAVLPRQALAVGVVFTSCVPDLLVSSDEFMFQFENRMEDVTIDGQTAELSPLYILTVLIEAGFIEFLLDSEYLIAGKRVVEILDLDKSGYAPALATDGVERRRGYAKTQTSDLFKEAVHALEATEYQASTNMLEIARQVYKFATGEQRTILMKNDYVLKGTAAMVEGLAYVSEFFGDLRGRLYQASCFGPNGQSSDLARSLMDLSGVSLDYDVNEAMELLWHEMQDMGDFVSDDMMMADIMDCNFAPVEFILSHMEKLNHITKPWNFVKFAMLYSDLGNYLINEDLPKPYIGIAVGLDAKCSGPQLGACMVADQKMLAATGFTQTQIDDAYHNALSECVAVGIVGLTRSLVKKAFMAVFYGAGKGAMVDAETITLKTFNALYAGLTLEQMEEKAEFFYNAINKSFGPALNKVRASIKQAGYDFDNEVSKLNAPIRYEMPDGFKVAMEYKYKLDIDGELVVGKSSSTVQIESMFESITFKNTVFSTDEYDMPSFARTGFVNMIQATDALLARLIIVHANRLGAQHIIAVHDCFRVNIHDMAILKEAIKAAYMDLFGKMKDTPTSDMPNGTDILSLYFKGNKEATKPEYTAQAPSHSQFFKNGTRYLRAVNGVKFADLVADLGNTYYFAK